MHHAGLATFEGGDAPASVRLLLTVPVSAEKSARFCNGDVRREAGPAATFLNLQPGRPEVLQGGQHQQTQKQHKQVQHQSSLMLAALPLLFLE